MSDDSKTLTPAYTTYTSFSNLINDLRDNGIPPHIQHSVVKGSNSGKAVMLASLKALKLVNDDKTPTNELNALVKDKENYKSNLESVLKNAYPFLFDGTIDLSNTTTETVSGRFKDAGASGSTIIKGMAFFLSAAKEAGIAVSSRVKAPSQGKSNGNKRKTPAKTGNTEEEKVVFQAPSEEAPEGTEKISFTLRGMPDVTVFFPADMTDENEIERVIKATVYNLRTYYGLDTNNKTGG